MAYGLSLITQVKYVRIKIIQFSFIESIPLIPFYCRKLEIAIEHIRQFIEVVSKMEHFEKFDFYFRK